MNDKIVRHFDDLYLYDAITRSTGTGVPCLYIDKIKVKAEVLLEGATETVYCVRYQDGITAYVPKTMYSSSEEDAISNLLIELNSSITCLNDRINVHTEELSTLRKYVECVRGHEKS